MVYYLLPTPRRHGLLPAMMRADSYPCDCPMCPCCQPVSLLYAICEDCRGGIHKDTKTGVPVHGRHMGSIRAGSRLLFRASHEI